VHREAVLQFFENPDFMDVIVYEQQDLSETMN
jgi:hypothetical protein